MNCPTCGALLPQAAANCPQCGTTTPYYYAQTGIAPDDPTMVSSSETDTQPPAPPSLYGASLYHNPYESYDAAPPAPPPPPPHRPRNRIGILVGVVLLILLLIGGGVVAWLAYSSSQNATAVAARATATAQTNARATAAVQHFTAKGTFTIVSRTTPTVRQDGSNKISTYTQ